MSILETIFDLDQRLLFNINQNWTNSLFDLYFVNITDLHKTPIFNYFVIPVFIFALLFYRKKIGLLQIVFLAITIGLSDLIAGKFLKPSIARLRPEVAGLDVLVKAPYFSDTSFPSAHAVNIFSAAIFLSYIFPKFKFYFIFFAACVSYSRVYVGVHYPSDVILGAMLGCIIGFFCSKIYSLFLNQLRIKKLL